MLGSDCYLQHGCGCYLHDIFFFFQEKGAQNLPLTQTAFVLADMAAEAESISQNSSYFADEQSLVSQIGERNYQLYPQIVVALLHLLGSKTADIVSP